MSEQKRLTARVAQDLFGLEINPNWTGIDSVMPVFDAIANEGCIVLIKIDGQRTSEFDSGKYTVLVSGGPLAKNPFRIDTDSLEDGLCQAILHYADWSPR